MKRDEVRSHIVSCIICCLPMIMTAILWDKLPEDIAIHFNENWEPDGYANKVVAGYFFPAGMALINLALRLFPTTDERYKTLPKPIKLVTNWLIPVLTILIIPYTLMDALGYKIGMSRLLIAIVGLLLMILGNYIPKCPQNKYFGFKLPWTYKSEQNWRKTHHLAGYLMIISGAIQVVCQFIDWYASDIMLFLLLIWFVPPILFSFLYYYFVEQRHQE